MRRRVAEEHAWQESHELPQIELARVQEVKEPIIEFGLRCQHEVAFASPNPKAQGECRSAPLNPIECDLHLRCIKAVPQCAHDCQAVQRWALQPVDLSRFKCDGAIEPQAEAIDKVALPTLCIANETDIDLSTGAGIRRRYPTRRLPQAIGIVIGRADRQDSEGGFGSVRTENAIGYFMHSPIATGGCDQGAARAGCLQGQLLGMTRKLRVEKASLRSELMSQMLQSLCGSATASRRIDDYTGCRVAHLTTLYRSRDLLLGVIRLHMDSSGVSMADTASSGLLVLDKPAGITSRAALDRAQRWFPRHTRLGHTGTLDPLATGVLVLCVGVATRLTEYIQRMAKTYTAVVTLGARSDSDDADGVITEAKGHRLATLPEVEHCITGFIGQIAQVPPAYSAAKVAGRRAYKLARGGQEVTLQARLVTIKRIRIMAFEWPHLELEVYCGKGTYIRSLARDLGEQLGCGGYIKALRRTQVGPFTATDALTLDADKNTIMAKLLPLSMAVSELPRVTLADAEVTRLQHGQRVNMADAPSGEIAVFDMAGSLVAVGLLEEKELRPVKVLSDR